MKQVEGTGPLEPAIDKAIGSDVRPLYDFLCRVSGLPGVRVNAAIVEAFAVACAARGKKSDALLRTMAALHPDEAPGGTVLEFLPVCATAAIGARAASDARARDSMLALLHELAEDMRFRVRDAVPEALAAIGARTGDALLADVDGWMDGFFHAAAVLRALARPEWLTAVTDGEAVAERVRQSFALLDGANRSARRYPGFKALSDALVPTPRAFGPRFGSVFFDAWTALASTKDPDLAALIARGIDEPSLRGRFADELGRVKSALADAAPVPRDPSRIVKGTRRRGRR